MGHAGSRKTGHYYKKGTLVDKYRRARRVGQDSDGGSAPDVGAALSQEA